MTCPDCGGALEQHPVTPMWRCRNHSEKMRDNVNHYPRHVGDFASATMGLSLTERGAYNALLDQYYAHERPLPIARSEVYRMAAATSAIERKAVDYVIARYFTQEPDGWHNKRADEEIAKYREKAAKASQSALARWNERNANALPSPTPDAMRTHSEGNANQNQNQKEHWGNGKVRENSDAMSDSRKAANADAARRILEFLNAETGHHYRPTRTTLKPIVERLKEGFSEVECRAVVVRRCNAWLKDDKMRDYLRPETLFGATKFAQYVGEVPLDSKSGGH